MTKLHDPELELFKRTVDLADYAKRAGYELRPQDGAPGERAMKTALQLRTLAGDERPRAELLSGTPCDVKEATLGPVARFESGQLVAYQIRSRRRRRLFVFRTLDVDDAFAVVVPGVRPRVQLLMELPTAGRIRLVRSLFAYLTRTGWDPSALPDIFYVRVAAALGGRLPPHKVLVSLLKKSASADGGIIATPGASRAQLAPDVA